LLLKREKREKRRGRREEVRKKALEPPSP